MPFRLFCCNIIPILELIKDQSIQFRRIDLSVIGKHFLIVCTFLSVSDLM